MTTIAYRDGIMAADSRAYTGGKTPIGIKTKIRKLDNGVLIGCSSSVPGGGERVIEWYADGAQPQPGDLLPDSFTLLVVKPNGECFFAADKPFISGPIIDEYYAIGSGEHYALGAMAMGATAKQAIKAAIKFDVWSAKPIISLTNR